MQVLEQVLEQVKVSKKMHKETLINVARTSPRTKVHARLADVLTEAVVILFWTLGHGT